MTNNITILETIFKLAGLKEYTNDRIRKNGNRAWQDSKGRIYTSHANGYIRVREVTHSYWGTYTASYQMNPVCKYYTKSNWGMTERVDRVMVMDEAVRMLYILRRHMGRISRGEFGAAGR